MAPISARLLPSSTLLLLAGFSLSMLAAGCAENATGPPRPSGPSEVTMEGLRLEFAVEPTTVEVGDTVTATVRVTNMTDSMVVLATPNGCLFVPDVFFRGTTEVAFEPTYFCTGAFKEWTLEAGAVLSRSREVWTGTWLLPGPVPWGEYVVEAGLHIVAPFEPPTLRRSFRIG